MYPLRVKIQIQTWTHLIKVGLKPVTQYVLKNFTPRVIVNCTNEIPH